MLISWIRYWMLQVQSIVFEKRRSIFMSNQMPPQGSDLPVHARERLSVMRGDATHRGLFTSDLSVNEFLLVREAGFDPVGLVVGSSIYHIGGRFVTRISRAFPS